MISFDEGSLKNNALCLHNNSSLYLYTVFPKLYAPNSMKFVVIYASFSFKSLISRKCDHVLESTAFKISVSLFKNSFTLWSSIFILFSTTIVRRLG